MSETSPATVQRSDAHATFVASDELPPLTHFIDGAFVPGTGDATTTLVDPSTETPIADVPRGSSDDVDRAVAAANAALAGWRRTTPKHRAELLLRIADRIDEAHDRLERLESLNAGKPHEVAVDDVASASDVFRFSAGAARSFAEVGSSQYVEGHTSIILREPVGVVGAIVSWNYPLLMAAWKIAPILAAGNTLVIKPSEQTPLSLLALCELVADILPAGVANLVLGLGREVGARLSSHPDIALVALTGSVGSGRTVAAAASETVKRVHLELGGKAPLVILADADLELAAQTIRTAGFWNSGQECGSGTRVLVHESVADRFTDLLVEQVGALAIGEPWAGDGIEIGPLFSKAHYERVLAFIERATSDGAVAAVGGGALEGPGYFVAPTVLTNVAPGSYASQEEAFGPIVTVETFATLDEAVTRANEVEYGLAASVWTSDASAALELPHLLDFGTVWVNTHLVIANEVPWGGFKGSGYGRDLSSYALDDYSRTKHVQFNHSSVAGLGGGN
ncbi:aldehyde dehydrogenase family protein [Pseudoclavibacter chungangensis]|uniref:Aldehyde dehydrogenase family protein n=1 Tax=Pseudoclavibacter chungangensis TaxID=587635 RepID=A0A7J5BQT2_9MICO|nr:aldehyde dehydrogenase family protein [Pseudoclavibacter chungangensis]KAB1656351.1 aldehyde dehydrogenase family protein [Pseudoclavibacter chungangensis]NYJ67123.1 aminobutyraldehyde dehydrogenase [Pseudoclavibacter chungangensis]